MIKHLQIKLKQQNFGLLRLIETQEEFYKKMMIGGLPLFSEFAIKLTPNGIDKINIIIEAEESFHIDTIAKGVGNALDSILATINYYGIGFAGFDLQLSCGRFHPIDSRPIGYELPVKEIILRLIATNHFEKSIVRFTAKNKLFESFKTEQEKQYKYFERDISISLPFQYPKSLAINGHWKTKAIYGDSPEDNKKGVLAIEIEGNSKGYKTNEIAIKFEGTIKPALVNALVDQCKTVIRFVYQQKMNLRGMNITIAVQNEWDKHSIRQMKLEPLAWVMKSILFHRDNFELTEEKYFKKVT
ncbi:MAG: hypothetical protein AB8G15_08820 [Saprospiraceae bacterium]